MKLQYRLVLLAAAFATATALIAQTTPVPANPNAEAKDNAIKLSPFEVRNDKDQGYVATSTLAGTRLNTTLRDNLRVARPDATDEAIRLACEKSNAWEFIAALPGGLDARVGEGGSMLSGGQRQRLAIARALLAEPACFIFDEATSALDTLSEQLISQALEHNLGDRTAVFIAHRLSTVKHCDRIFVLS